MWSLITQHQPPDVPIPEVVTAQPGWTGQGVRRSRKKSFNPPRGWTYGNLLRKQETCPRRERVIDAVDEDLRTLIMRCMMDNPMDRPDLDELRMVIDAKLKKGWRGRNSARETRNGAQAQMLWADPPSHDQRFDYELEQVGSESIPKGTIETLSEQMLTGLHMTVAVSQHGHRPPTLCGVE